MQVSKIQFTKASFWVRVHDLPLMARNKYVGGLVRNFIGVVEEIDLEKWEIEWREYMHIWGKMNITKPISKRKKLNLGLSKLVWVTLSYERLLDIYNACGTIGHSQRA